MQYLKAEDVSVMIYVNSWTQDENGLFDCIVQLARTQVTGPERTYKLIRSPLSLVQIAEICEDPVRVSLDGR